MSLTEVRSLRRKVLSLEEENKHLREMARVQNNRNLMGMNHLQILVNTLNTTIERQISASEVPQCRMGK